MLSEQDVAEIRKLKDDLDQEEANLKAATRETETTKSRIKQVRASIRPAARTRFTSWLTNSDPEEHRRYRAAIAEHKDQLELVSQLKPLVAAKDARITAAVEECLERSDQTYRKIKAKRDRATSELDAIGRSQSRSASLRSQVDAALTQTQQLRDADAKDARKAMDLTTAQITAGVNTMKSELMALAPRMREHGSFPAGRIQNLRAEFSGRRADLNTRRAELTTIRASLDSIHNALTSASNGVSKRRRDLAGELSAIVQQARAQALGADR